MWLSVHYQGTLEVSIDGMVRYKRVLGDMSSKLRYLIRDSCKLEDDSHGNSPDLEISIAVGKSFKTILKTTDFQTGDWSEKKIPSKRQKLYDMEQISSSHDLGYLTCQELQDVGVTAQLIAKWMLDLSIRSDTSDNLAFVADLEDTETVALTLGQLLQNWPSIGLINFGSVRKPISIFRDPQDPLMKEITISEATEKSFDNVVKCFPLLQDLVINSQQRCQCFDCSRPKARMAGISGGRRTTRPGCLQDKCVKLFCVLLAHTIADAFGAPDVSGLTEISALTKMVQSLLIELVHHKTILWDKWFAVATMVFLGCPPVLEGINAEHIEGASSIVAVQFGSLTTVSNWVDLTKELHVDGCYGFKFAEGNLQGVPQQFAIVQAEQQMGLIVDSRRFNNSGLTFSIPAKEMPLPMEIQKLFDLSQIDNCELACEAAIVGGADIPYRLLTMVQSGEYIRIIDPSAAISALSRSVTFTCHHSCKYFGLPSLALKLSLWNSSSILASWGSNFELLQGKGGGTFSDLENKVQDPPSLNAFLTTPCDTFLKMNVALSTSAEKAVIRKEDCCINCALFGPQFNEAKGPYDGIRRIINVNIAPQAMVTQIRSRRL